MSGGDGIAGGEGMAGGDGMSGGGGITTVPSPGAGDSGAPEGASEVGTGTLTVTEVGLVVSVVVVSLVVVDVGLVVSPSPESPPHAAAEAPTASAAAATNRTDLLFSRGNIPRNYPAGTELNRPGCETRCQPRATLPAFRQEVHTLTRFLLPPGWLTARTDWMFGFHRRLVRRWECDTDLPKPGPFPQTSHTAAISRTP